MRYRVSTVTLERKGNERSDEFYNRISVFLQLTLNSGHSIVTSLAPHPDIIIIFIAEAA